MSKRKDGFVSRNRGDIIALVLVAVALGAFGIYILRLIWLALFS